MILTCQYMQGNATEILHFIPFYMAASEALATTLSNIR